MLYVVCELLLPRIKFEENDIGEEFKKEYCLSLIQCSSQPDHSNVQNSTKRITQTTGVYLGGSTHICCDWPGISSSILDLSIEPKAAF